MRSARRKSARRDRIARASGPETHGGGRGPQGVVRPPRLSRTEALGPSEWMSARRKPTRRSRIGLASGPELGEWTRQLLQRGLSIPGKSRTHAPPMGIPAPYRHKRTTEHCAWEAIVERMGQTPGRGKARRSRVQLPSGRVASPCKLTTNTRKLTCRRGDGDAPCFGGRFRPGNRTAKREDILRRSARGHLP